MPDSFLGGYEILTPLGAGGMGEMYRARDSKLRRHVAIKVLPAAFAANADRVARFEREAHAVAADVAICSERATAGRPIFNNVRSCFAARTCAFAAFGGSALVATPGS